MNTVAAWMYTKKVLLPVSLLSDGKEIKTFGTMTNDIIVLVDWKAPVYTGSVSITSSNLNKLKSSLSIPNI